MISEAQRREAAQTLAAAERDRAAVPPLRETYPDLDAVDAYQIQLLQIRDKLAAGARIRGHKVGLSSKAMQKMIGVDTPDYGHLLDTMFVDEGAVIPAADFCFPRIEIEVAFVLRRELPAPGCSVADVLAATDYVAPSLEIIDSRIEGWNIRLFDTISDNASSARLVLGGTKTKVEDVDLRTIGAVLRKNGEIAETGASGAVLGHPAIAVAWLANTVHSFGVTLGEGHVILPGSCTRAIDVVPGDVIRGDFDRLGHVSVKFS